MKMITIPAKGDDIRLSEEIQLYLILQVPKGRLTTYDDIRKFLCKLYGAATIDFEQPINMRNIPEYHKFWNNITKSVPFHRVVSSDGEIHNIFNMDRLENEGFKLLSKANSLSKKVENYKKYLFDFEKETNIDIAILEKVQKEGIDKFLN